MAAFAGIVRFDGAPIGAELEDRLIRAVSILRKGPTQLRRAPGVAFAHRGDSPGDNFGGQPIIAEDKTLFVGRCRLDNRAELGAALNIANPELARLSDARLMMRMVKKRGDAGVARCLGGFAFASWDADHRVLTLGRDCLGFTHTLFFFRAGGVVAFATTLVALLSLPFVPHEINEIALANYMAFNMRETRHTFYRGVERVPTRTIVALDRDGTRHRYYWSPDLGAPPPYRRDADYIERARELFDQAVAASTAGFRDIAISTSGGLDSSAIAATAARLGQVDHITCYTMVPPPGHVTDPRSETYQDETDKVQALARMHPRLDLRLLMPQAPHPLEVDATRYFAETGWATVVAANQGWFAHLFDAVVSGRHPVLVEGIHGNLGLTWNGEGFLWELLRRGEWRRLHQELVNVAAERGHGLPRTFLSHVVISNMPAAVHRVVHRLRGRDPRSVARFSPLNPSFIAQHDLPRQWREAGYDPWFRRGSRTVVRLRASFLFDYNQLGRDNISVLEERYGFQSRTPHVDRRLLEFALTVPETMYRRDGVPRWFARQVFADRLPREILDERRLGVQGGAWFRRLDIRRQEIADEVERLEASPLARRMLDLPRLKRLVDDWPKSDDEALSRRRDYRLVFYRGLQFGRFLRWVEGGNA
jgi:asparagine synthase (glutamine-hydrolysing)